MEGRVVVLVLLLVLEKCGKCVSGSGYWMLGFRCRGSVSQRTDDEMNIEHSTSNFQHRTVDSGRRTEDGGRDEHRTFNIELPTFNIGQRGFDQLKGIALRVSTLAVLYSSGHSDRNPTTP